ncbi:hypothetical protein A2716_03900 [candidate division WWE3 bacterium RIFCSPHIGHO2_01_FULL_40_23]|uniref:Uncharacterized protein n=1 Tax=candidate division WWE3 bacterium RIFCSPLOWO2_01_FULL_41_18 TaxID=1802625 RepID=A0A1F4VEA0_UNCKA|nr:MAG: hypothetical protein A2716_03900 [candidate division WWE3 bacterium RIFCSPHIGHO2_01_FULL_40_23]OGC55023.1 MAG: hypothetical protein A3A78_03510 [candidate division WWE3 bacterium RIFCSPLOWO2_01_FULL_41_18]
MTVVDQLLEGIPVSLEDLKAEAVRGEGENPSGVIMALAAHNGVDNVAPAFLPPYPKRVYEAIQRQAWIVSVR